MKNLMGKGGGASPGGVPLSAFRHCRGWPGRLLACAVWLVLMNLSGTGPGSGLGAETAAAAGQPSGLGLVMIEEQGCGFCLRWHREVGPGYAKSDEGRSAPLVLIDRESKEASRFPRIVFTPTFILTRDGTEVGRITGYPGADLFWWQLGDLIRKQLAASSGRAG